MTGDKWNKPWDCRSDIYTYRDSNTCLQIGNGNNEEPTINLLLYYPYSHDFLEEYGLPIQYL